jgi:GNAT superfamily N-acetyltransferase
VSLARILVASWLDAYRGLVPDSHLISLSVDHREARWRRSLAEGLEETYILEEGQQGVGLLTVSACQDEDLAGIPAGEMRRLYVAPHHWRKGFATCLVRKAERLFQDREYGCATLWVLEGNQSARRFYEVVGYHPDGATRIIHLGAPLAALRYRKELGNGPTTPTHPPQYLHQCST